MSKLKYMSEGESSTKPPLFDCTDYYFCRGKMKLFVQSQDNNMWYVVQNILLQ